MSRRAATRPTYDGAADPAAHGRYLNTIVQKLLATPAWMDDAACIDSPLDFMIEDVADQPGAAAVCSTCPVRTDCAAEAVERGAVHGIWAGQLLLPEENE